MKQTYVLLVGIFLIGTSAILMKPDNQARNQKRILDVEQLAVSDVLLMLGDDTLIHHVQQVDPQKVKVGEDLVLNGFTERDGKKTKRISTHFVCTDCHNLKREFDDITSDDPADRLKYAKANDIPFLPASTFWGIYNRTSFYNKDYVKKYGDLVVNARDSLDNATQVCAKYCSSGRYLEQWELDAVMQYFKSLELRVKDLGLDATTLKSLRNIGKLSSSEKDKVIAKIKGAYIHKYDATFLETLPREERKYGEGGDPENGELIYEESCMYCHGSARLTYLSLGKNKLDARMFWYNKDSYRDQSLYQIVRHGTYSKPGRRQYMPLYTEEKMSDVQLNDLMAYLKQLAEK
ncbi:cytochrome c [Crocinitomicaceae bacterium]|nr:cytochrome c [Crocinitomicaceae bacterium]